MTHLTLEAGNPAHGGYCVARIPDDGGSPLAGKVALVTGTLPGERVLAEVLEEDRKSTRLNSSHCIGRTSYAVFCLDRKSVV